MVLKNIELAEKPDDIQAVAVVSSSDEYFDYVKPRLEGLFKKIKIIRNPDEGLDHGQLRAYQKRYSTYGLGKEKLRKIEKTYDIVLENLDRSADYYWFIEDDNLFPLDTLKRHQDTIEFMKADISAGVSYFWSKHSPNGTNFWTIIRTKAKDNSGQEYETVKVEKKDEKESGIERLGAAGLCNILASKRSVLSWTPARLERIGSGADISFFLNAEDRGYPAYGNWGITLPHITIYPDGNIAILGKIDPSISPIIFNMPPDEWKRRMEIKKKQCSDLTYIPVDETIDIERVMQTGIPQKTGSPTFRNGVQITR
jgi:hypothetical protein